MFLILRTPIVWYNLGVMIQPYIAIAVAFGIAGLLALPGAMGLKLRMIRLKSAELVLFLAMAAIGIIGYGDKFSPTNDPPRGTSAQLADGNASAAARAFRRHGSGAAPRGNGGAAPPSRSLPVIALDPSLGPFSNAVPPAAASVCHIRNSPCGK